MSVLALAKDVLTGNFTNVGARLKDWWNDLSPSIQTFLAQVETAEGKILQSLVPVAAKDVISGGFSTASFVAAALDVGQKLLAQNIVMAQTTIFSALNAEVGTQAAAAGVEVPTNSGSAVPTPVVLPAAE